MAWTTVVQFAPIKTEGGIPTANDARPVGCGRWLGAPGHRQMCALLLKKAALRKACQGTSAGIQTHGMIVGIHMQAFPMNICVKLKVDLKNAFNEIERAAMVGFRTARHTLDDMHRYLEAHLRPSSRIYYLSGGKLVLAEYHSSQSGQQGAFEASGGYRM